MVVMVVVVVGVLLWKKIKCGIVTARYDKNRYIDLMKFGVQQWMARREWGYFGKMDDVGNGKQEEEGRRSVKTGSNREGEVRAEFILGRGGVAVVAVVAVAAAAAVVVDGGRLGYMTFVSMVMVSPSPTRRETVLWCVCVHACVYLWICVMAFFCQ